MPTVSGRCSRAAVSESFPIVSSSPCRTGGSGTTTALSTAMSSIRADSSPYQLSSPPRYQPCYLARVPARPLRVASRRSPCCSAWHSSLPPGAAASGDGTFPTLSVPPSAVRKSAAWGDRSSSMRRGERRGMSNHRGMTNRDGVDGTGSASPSWSLRRGVSRRGRR